MPIFVIVSYICIISFRFHCSTILHKNIPVIGYYINNVDLYKCKPLTVDNYPQGSTSKQINLTKYAYSNI